MCSLPVEEMWNNGLLVNECGGIYSGNLGKVSLRNDLGTFIMDLHYGFTCPQVNLGSWESAQCCGETSSAKGRAARVIRLTGCCPTGFESVNYLVVTRHIDDPIGVGYLLSRASIWARWLGGSFVLPHSGHIMLSTMHAR